MMRIDNGNENKIKEEEMSYTLISEYASEMKFHTASAFDIFNCIKNTMVMCTTTLYAIFLDSLRWIASIGN